ncbi:hypothetical protein LSUE1_G002741 [Lachnellula suecica]|uniref:Uncharacterized protein n=1 Tax=Lachnellula suecica TaxID=602035 RepID=A0A8T9CH50_9HELO|nr:hypothetical protein LSUE1_G002741 [Lachnellula suecica]
MATKNFFNLPQSVTSISEKHKIGTPKQHAIYTNWSTFEDQSLSRRSLLDVFTDRIPVVREQGILTVDERKRMLEIVRTHDLGTYDTEHTWPRLGFLWIPCNFIDFRVSDKTGYFESVKDARSLQNRWKNEAGVDIVKRVVDRIRQTTGMKVQVASEQDSEYFAGVLRAVDRGILVHADYAPYEAAGWKIGDVVAQVTWNILLNEVPGGDTLIYDRQWQAPEDDLAWRKEFPKDTYHPQMLQAHPFKAMKAVPGDLTFFNPRYSIDRPEQDCSP